MSIRKPAQRILFVAVLSVAAWHLLVLGFLGARFEPSDATDRAVLLTALEHLGRQEQSQRSRNKGAATIYVHDETIPFGSELFELRYRAWPRNWQLAGSIEGRNVSEEELRWASTARLQVLDVKEFRYWELPEDSDFRCYVRLSKPGYSRDGRMALVKLQLEPSHHGIDVVYLLTFDGEVWSVARWACSVYG